MLFSRVSCIPGGLPTEIKATPIPNHNQAEFFPPKNPFRTAHKVKKMEWTWLEMGKFRLALSRHLAKLFLRGVTQAARRNEKYTWLVAWDRMWVLLQRRRCGTLVTMMPEIKSPTTCKSSHGSSISLFLLPICIRICPTLWGKLSRR